VSSSPSFLRDLVARAVQAGGGEIRSVCSAVPRELIEAFGLDVRRMLPPGTVASESRGESLSSASVCAWCKSALGSAEADIFWVGAATCDQMRRALELAGRKSGSAAIIIHAPKTRTSEAEELYRDELAWLAGELERRTGRRLDPDNLRRSITARNAIRRKIRDLRPALSGSDFVALVHLDAMLPAAEMAAFLESHAFGHSCRPGMPVMVAGSPLAPADLRWLDLLESSGFSLAADATCTGDRAVDFDVVDDGEPLAALTRAYHRRPPCIFIRPNDEFYDYAGDLARKRGARAVIWRSVRGCDLYNLESQRAEKRLGLPFLALDMSYGDVDSPRVRTRVEAFAESLR
jgi:benzoyl-CoA reductase/2-hydroxyglutaryl-CoA dehydratase subunit BcrC/BadD/HgdB